MSIQSSYQPSVNNSVLIIDDPSEEQRLSICPSLKNNFTENFQESLQETKIKKSTKISIEVGKLLKSKTNQLELGKSKPTNHKKSMHTNHSGNSLKNIHGKPAVKSFEQMYVENLSKKKQLTSEMSNPYSHYSSINHSLEKMRLSLQSKPRRQIPCPNSCKNSQNSKQTENRCFKKSKNFIRNKQNIDLLQLDQTIPEQIQSPKQKVVQGLGTVKRKILRTKSIRSRNNSDFSSVSQHSDTNAVSIIDSKGNQNHFQALKQQFHQAVDKVVDHLEHSHIRGNTQCFFSLDQMIKILREMKYVKEEDCSKSPCAPQIESLWKQLGGQIYGGVVRENLYSFLAIIESGADPCLDIMDYPRKPKVFINSNLQLQRLSQADITHIQSLYWKLIQNRRKEVQQCQKIGPQVLAEKVILRSKQKTSSIVERKEDLNTASESKELTRIIHEDESSGEKDLFCNIELQSHEQKPSGNQSERSNKQDAQKPQETILKNYRYTETNSPSNSQGESLSNEIFSDFTSHYKVEESGIDEVDFSPKLMPELNQILFQESNKSVTLFRECLPQFQESQKGDLENQNESESVQNGNQQKENVVDEFQNQKRKPLLSVDVNLGEGNVEKLIVYEGQTPYQVSIRLVQKYQIDESLRQKFEQMLNSHIRNLLFKIDQVSEELLEQEETNSFQRQIEEELQSQSRRSNK